MVYSISFSKPKMWVAYKKDTQEMCMKDSHLIKSSCLQHQRACPRQDLVLSLHMSGLIMFLTINHITTRALGVFMMNLHKLAEDCLWPADFLPIWHLQSSS
jgi:hypothetical protein